MGVGDGEMTATVANPFALTGKVTLVTGANSGLGLGWAKAIAAAGGDVVLWGRRADANAAAAAAVEELGVRALAQAVDVSDEEAVVAAVAEAVTEMGRLDGAVVNAGINTEPLDFVEMASETWFEVLDVNLHGAYFTLREVARHMVGRAGHGDPSGSIVTCGGLAVTQSVPRLEHYAASKGGLAAMTRAMAAELGAHGIRANMVLPGRIATHLAGTTPEEKIARTDLVRQIPIPRYGLPGDVAGIVVYLLSDAAAYHTGDLITVDGGLSIKLP